MRHMNYKLTIKDDDFSLIKEWNILNKCLKTSNVRLLETLFPPRENDRKHLRGLGTKYVFNDMLISN